MRVCVFVDGENFRHSIVDLFPTFNEADYLPNGNWANLFDWIVEKATSGAGHRIRTYWYVIKTLDFSPYKYRFPDPTKTRDTAKISIDLLTLHKVLCQHDPYKIELARFQGVELLRQMQEKVNELKQRQDTMQKRFNGWTIIQDGISLGHKSIEFRRAGAIKYDLFTTDLGKEKAVDVKLAADLITLKDIYDVAIIVSGDQDYVPAVEVVKDLGKQMVNVAFCTRSGKLLPGGARRLNVVTDWSYNIPHDVLAHHLQITQLPLPTMQP